MNTYKYYDFSAKQNHLGIKLPDGIQVSYLSHRVGQNQST